MEIYDIIMLVILAGAAIFGAIKGFAWQLASIASIVVSYFVAYRFREPFSESIQAEPPWNRFLAMLILFIGTALVIWVGFRMISKSIDRMKLREFDRQIGALFGLAKGGLYCILITLFAVTLLGESVRLKVVASKSGHYISSILDKSESVIPAEIHQVVRPYLDKFDEKFDGTISPAPSANSPFGGLADQALQSVTQGVIENATGFSPDQYFVQPGNNPTNVQPVPIQGQNWSNQPAAHRQNVQPQAPPPAWNSFQN